MTKNFQEFQPFPAGNLTSDLLDKAANAVSNAETALANMLTHAPDDPTGGLGGEPWAGEQLPLPGIPPAADLPVLADVVPERYVIADDGQVSLSPPYLLIRYADGRVTVRTYADAKVMTRAHVQAVKPTGQLPPGTSVIAVYRGGARVEKTKRAG